MKHIQNSLNKRIAQDSLRVLPQEEGLIDFCSNDYLGFARSDLLKERINKKLSSLHANGATGSRLISGNSAYTEDLEVELASFHLAESGLIFNSGYDANIGLFSSMAGRDDTIIYDELSHASIRDGIRLSFSHSYSFRHNDLQDLKKKIEAAKGDIFIAVESVYSMDGDFAPLNDIVEIAKQHRASVIVDEAHASGLFGASGAGLVAELGLTKEIFARVHTFGKALGCHGAVVLGTKTLRDFLINFARSFIYTTALGPHSLLTVKEAYGLLAESQAEIDKLKSKILLFNNLKSNKQNWIESKSAIQSLVIPGNAEVKKAAAGLREHGFDVRAILSPTVPQGMERLRICLHTFNSDQEISELQGYLSQV